MALRGLSGEFGRAAVEAGLRLADYPESNDLGPEMRYAFAVNLIARNAPLRIIPGGLIVGAATYRESIFHLTPILNESSTSHLTLGFDRVLKIGYKGIRREIEDRVALGGLDEKGLDLLCAMRSCLDAANIWHDRYVSALEELVSSGPEEERQNYAEVLANLRNVPENPPTTFREAVQSLWFAYAFQRLCGNWSGIGRIDQMLGGFLSADIDNGTLTLDEARELLAHFWISGTEWIGAKTAPDSGDAQHYQNIILGGVDKENEEVANDVTYLVLDIARELKISDFPIAVRISRNSPEKLLVRVAEAWQSCAGFVSIYNEDVVISALVKFGYPMEEAREFTNDGCWEPIIPGKTSFLYSTVDLLSCLQRTLGLGEDGSGAAPEFPDFDGLYRAFIGSLTRVIEDENAGLSAYNRDGLPAPLISMLIDGCIESGRGYYDRGPCYTVFAMHAGGMANAGNSLFAIKKLVYEDKRLTLPELVEILRNDWEGHEPLRRRILKEFEFYGNDNDEVDGMVMRIFDDFTEITRDRREVDGVLRPAGISTFGREISWVPDRAATADGHRKGEILAGNFSPSPGTDRKGPLAALKSYCKMDFEKLPNCGTLELKIFPPSVRGESGIAALIAMERAFVRLGGMYLNIDVIDTETLLDAQAHPERYPNLAVRIAGWNARFATLDKDWQKIVINRTQQVIE
jgi:formate C-acetyltransferase